MTLTFDLRGHCDLWHQSVKNPSLSASGHQRGNLSLPIPHLWDQGLHWRHDLQGHRSRSCQKLRLNIGNQMKTPFVDLVPFQNQSINLPEQ